MPYQLSRDFLRVCRRAAGFSQSELVPILGLRDQSHLSRIERGMQMLKLEQAIRYELLFGIPMAKISEVFCQHVHNGLWEDVTAALRTADTEHKRIVLRAALERIESLNN